MNEKAPLHERRPRTVGALGGLLISPIVVGALYLFFPLPADMVSLAIVFFAIIMLLGVAGAFFPRFGKLALQFAGEVLGNLS